MTWYTWAIIILLVISFYQYTNPAKANEMLKLVWGPVDDFIGKNNPLQSNNSGSICPDINEPVCGTDVLTYKNSCEAALKGILQVTPGVC